MVGYEGVMERGLLVCERGTSGSRRILKGFVLVGVSKRRWEREKKGPSAHDSFVPSAEDVVQGFEKRWRNGWTRGRHSVE